MTSFDIPICLFTFKRVDKVLQIIQRISEIKPVHIYILSDGGRNEEEQKEIENSRKIIESAINWDCQVTKRYSNKNIGVYDNIAGGAKWVFEREESAIFLEDDNLPELTFFQFCKELLEKYNDDNRILWICGTNYLKKYQPADGASYVFTQHMLPCGWASWANKFSKFYDGDMSIFENKYYRERISNLDYYKPLRRQDIDRWNMELQRRKAGLRFVSWDHQMNFSLRAHNVYGIVPCNNQIRNIGVDLHSVHGGISLENEMTRRFCELETFPIEFPLKHPMCLQTDIKFDDMTAKIITIPMPLKTKFLMPLIVLKHKLGIKRSLRFWR